MPRKIFTRNNKRTNELTEFVEKTFNGLKMTYKEVFYLDCFVDENTGNIDPTIKVKHYTSNQVRCNLKTIKELHSRMN